MKVFPCKCNGGGDRPRQSAHLLPPPFPTKVRFSKLGGFTLTASSFALILIGLFAGSESLETPTVSDVSDGGKLVPLRNLSPIGVTASSIGSHGLQEVQSDEGLSRLEGLEGEVDAKAVHPNKADPHKADPNKAGTQEEGANIADTNIADTKIVINLLQSSQDSANPSGDRSALCSQSQSQIQSPKFSAGGPGVEQSDPQHQPENVKNERNGASQPSDSQQFQKPLPQQPETLLNVATDFLQNFDRKKENEAKGGFQTKQESPTNEEFQTNHAFQPNQQSLFQTHQDFHDTNRDLDQDLEFLTNYPKPKRRSPHNREFLGRGAKRNLEAQQSVSITKFGIEKESSGMGKQSSAMEKSLSVSKPLIPVLKQSSATKPLNPGADLLTNRGFLNVQKSHSISGPGKGAGNRENGPGEVTEYLQKIIAQKEAKTVAQKGQNTKSSQKVHRSTSKKPRPPRTDKSSSVKAPGGSKSTDVNRGRYEEGCKYSQNIFFRNPLLQVLEKMLVQIYEISHYYDDVEDTRSPTLSPGFGGAKLWDQWTHTNVNNKHWWREKVVENLHLAKQLEARFQGKEAKSLPDLGEAHRLLALKLDSVAMRREGFEDEVFPASNVALRKESKDPPAKSNISNIHHSPTKSATLPTSNYSTSNPLSFFLAVFLQCPECQEKLEAILGKTYIRGRKIQMVHHLQALWVRDDWERVKAEVEDLLVKIKRVIKKIEHLEREEDREDSKLNNSDENGPAMRNGKNGNGDENSAPADLETLRAELAILSTRFDDEVVRKFFLLKPLERCVTARFVDRTVRSKEDKESVGGHKALKDDPICRERIISEGIPKFSIFGKLPGELKKQFNVVTRCHAQHFVAAFNGLFPQRKMTNQNFATVKTTLKARGAKDDGKGGKADPMVEWGEKMLKTIRMKEGIPKEEEIPISGKEEIPVSGLRRSQSKSSKTQMVKNISPPKNRKDDLRITQSKTQTVSPEEKLKTPEKFRSNSLHTHLGKFAIPAINDVGSDKERDGPGKPSSTTQHKKYKKPAPQKARITILNGKDVIPSRSVVESEPHSPKTKDRARNSGTSSADSPVEDSRKGVVDFRDGPVALEKLSGVVVDSEKFDGVLLIPGENAVELEQRQKILEEVGKSFYCENQLSGQEMSKQGQRLGGDTNHGHENQQQLQLAGSWSEIEGSDNDSPEGSTPAENNENSPNPGEPALKTARSLRRKKTAIWPRVKGANRITREQRKQRKLEDGDEPEDVEEEVREHEGRGERDHDALGEEDEQRADEERADDEHADVTTGVHNSQNSKFFRVNKPDNLNTNKNNLHKNDKSKSASSSIPNSNLAHRLPDFARKVTLRKSIPGSKKIKKLFEISNAKHEDHDEDKAERVVINVIIDLDEGRNEFGEEKRESGSSGSVRGEMQDPGEVKDPGDMKEPEDQVPNRGEDVPDNSLGAVNDDHRSQRLSNVNHHPSEIQAANMGSHSAQVGVTNPPVEVVEVVNTDQAAQAAPAPEVTPPGDIPVRKPRGRPRKSARVDGGGLTAPEVSNPGLGLADNCSNRTLTPRRQVPNSATSTAGNPLKLPDSEIQASEPNAETQRRGMSLRNRGGRENPSDSQGEAIYTDSVSPDAPDSRNATGARKPRERRHQTPLSLAAAARIVYPEKANPRACKISRSLMRGLSGRPRKSGSTVGNVTGSADNVNTTETHGEKFENKNLGNQQGVMGGNQQQQPDLILGNRPQQARRPQISEEGNKIVSNSRRDVTSASARIPPSTSIPTHSPVIHTRRNKKALQPLKEVKESKDESKHEDVNQSANTIKLGLSPGTMEEIQQGLAIKKEKSGVKNASNNEVERNLKTARTPVDRVITKQESIPDSTKKSSNQELAKSKVTVQPMTPSIAQSTGQQQRTPAQQPPPAPPAQQLTVQQPPVNLKITPIPVEDRDRIVDFLIQQEIFASQTKRPTVGTPQQQSDLRRHLLQHPEKLDQLWTAYKLEYARKKEMKMWQKQLQHAQNQALVQQQALIQAVIAQQLQQVQQAALGQRGQQQGGMPMVTGLSLPVAQPMAQQWQVPVSLPVAVPTTSQQKLPQESLSQEYTESDIRQISKKSSKKNTPVIKSLPGGIKTSNMGPPGQSLHTLISDLAGQQQGSKGVVNNGVASNALASNFGIPVSQSMPANLNLLGILAASAGNTHIPVGSMPIVPEVTGRHAHDAPPSLDPRTLGIHKQIPTTNAALNMYSLPRDESRPFKMTDERRTGWGEEQMNLRDRGLRGLDGLDGLHDPALQNIAVQDNRTDRNGGSGFFGNGTDGIEDRVDNDQSVGLGGHADSVERVLESTSVQVHKQQSARSRGSRETARSLREGDNVHSVERRTSRGVGESVVVVNINGIDMTAKDAGKFNLNRAIRAHDNATPNALGDCVLDRNQAYTDPDPIINGACTSPRLRGNSNRLTTVLQESVVDSFLGSE